MSSSSNYPTSPYVIIGNQPNSSAVSHPNEQTMPKQSNNIENHQQTSDDTLLRNSHRIAQLVYRFNQAIQVCFTSFYFIFQAISRVGERVSV